MPRTAVIPSTDEIFSWIETVFAQGIRRPGYPADQWTEQWARDKFTEFGLADVRLEPVPLDKWEDHETELIIWPADTPHDTQAIPCFALPHTTPVDNLELELALVKAAPDVARDKAAVTEFNLIRMPQAVMAGRASRVVDPENEFKTLTQTLPFSMQFQNVMQPAINAGARAFIGLLTGMPWETADYYVPYDAVERPIPGVWVSNAHSRRVTELLAAGPVHGRLTVRASRTPCTCHNVVGTLPGASDEWIVIGSHHDGPWASAVEDGSGIALVLAQAKYWGRIPERDRPHNLMFLLNAGHMNGGAGCRAFLDAHKNELANIVAEIHLEHAARECQCENGKLIPTDKPEVRWWFTSLNDQLEDIVEAALTQEQLGRSLIISPEMFGPHPTTDAGFFHVEGVPLINYLTAPMYLFDSQDTLDKIHTDSLEPVTRATIRIIEALGAHTAADLRANMRSAEGTGLMT